MHQEEIEPCTRPARCDFHFIRFSNLHFINFKGLWANTKEFGFVNFFTEAQKSPYILTSFASSSTTLLACSHTGGPGGPGDPRSCIACPSGEYSIPNARSFRCSRASNGYKDTNTITTRAVYGRLRYGRLRWYNTRTCGGVAVVVRRR